LIPLNPWESNSKDDRVLEDGNMKH
jgi:hypothetical protein